MPHRPRELRLMAELCKTDNERAENMVGLVVPPLLVPI
jgi:hypothetical protein